VFTILKSHPVEACRGAVHLTYMGQRVCNKAFHRLLSIGKERFQKLRASVRNGDEYCPYDARYIPKGKQPPSPARQLVFDFLHGLYEESAEVIPDGLNSNKRPRQAQHRKNWLHEAFDFLQLSGMGGPGIQRHTLDEGFWNKVGYEPRPCQQSVPDRCLLREPVVDIIVEEIWKRLGPWNPTFIDLDLISQLSTTEGYAAQAEDLRQYRGRTFAVVWANSVAPDLAQVISTNRGASEGAAAFASAYSLGRQESAAAVNLLKKVPPVVKDTLTTLEPLQRVCAAFIACLQQFQSMVPKAFADAALVDIHQAFELRHGDADILAMLEHGVPPVDLGNCIRLNAQLLQTTWQQTELQMKSDLELLKGWGRKFDLHSSQQGSLDFKFISDRYNRGKSEVEKLMTEKHVLHSCASITMAHAPIVNMQQQMGHSGLTLLIVDATLWPSRAVAIDEAIQMCQAISTGNCRTLAFILLPQPYNTGHKALVNKHRRLLEDKVHGCLA
ncbi:unnamed protein product, partial [Durusdinium trenchii]